VKQVRYGVIGAGAIAQRRHLPEAAANPRSRIVAVADINPQRARAVAAHYGAQAFTDYRDMIRQAALDAVVVAAPNVHHAPMTITALRAGLHVLCEKPMATSAPDARRMIAAASTARRLLMIAHNQRFMPAHLKAKKIIDNRTLGRILSFHTAFRHAGPEHWSVDGAASWFFRRDAAGLGVIGDLAVHKIDLLRWLLSQEFTSVIAQTATLDKRNARKKPIDLDDNATLLLTTAAGITGTISASWTNHGPEENSTAIYGTHAVMRIGSDPQFPVIIHHRNGDRDLHQLAPLASNTTQRPSGVIDSFTHAILHRRPSPIDGPEGLRCLAVLLAAAKSAATGRLQRIAPSLTTSRRSADQP
jgi:predicted dehydrogenase